MAIYEWAEQLHSACKGVGVSAKLDAQVVGDVIDKLAQQNDGEVRAEDFVEKSRPKRSPTHKLFEWDDTAAAEKFRHEQAKYVIRCIKVVHVDEKGKDRKVRAFHSVKSRSEPKKRIFVSSTEMITDEQRRIEILQDCLNQLVAWRRKWNELNEFVDAFSKVDSAIGEMQTTLVKKS